MHTIQVSKEYAEKVKIELIKFGILDKNRKIICVKFIEFSSKRKLNKREIEILQKYKIKEIQKDNPTFLLQKKPIDEIYEILEIPLKYKKLIPKKWEKFGDIVIFKLPEELKRFEKEIGRVYAKVLDVKTVLKETAPIKGTFREPSVIPIFGHETETIHKENSIKFKFDTNKIMFSSGNIDERHRMAYVSNKNEVVVDMFGGIGYFSIPMAYYSKPKKIYACELNGVAFSYLCENIKLNNVQNIISPLNGDNRLIAPKNIADRVIMGYLKNTIEFLPFALEILKDRGIIHYHEICPNELIPETTKEKIKNITDKIGKNVKFLNFKNIKSYAPGISHVVADVEIY